MASQSTQASVDSNPHPPRADGFREVAIELQSLSTLTKSEQIYRDAIQMVLEGISGQGLSKQEIELITSNRGTDELRKKVEDEMSKNSFWSPKGQSKFPWGKGVLKTFERFQAPIDALVQSSGMNDSNC